MQPGRRISQFAPAGVDGANSVFAYQQEPGDTAGRPFANARQITLARNEMTPTGLEVVAGDNAAVRTFHDAATGCCAYLWGLAAHPDVAHERLLPWIVEKTGAGAHPALRQLLGTFTALIDDRRNKRIRVVSDVIGLRPFFVGGFKGRLVCGSDVWAIQEAGLVAGGVSYDAVASWVRHGYDNTCTSLFVDYPQIGRGVVGTWENGAYRESPYAVFSGNQHTPPRAELIEVIHGHVSGAFEALTRDLNRVSISLSGGYDSRYLAALASQRKNLTTETFAVDDQQSESMTAAIIADKLRLPLGILPTDGSKWNMYREPFHFMHNGFPITKQASYLSASRRPGVPCLNGFLGDGIIRDVFDTWRGKTEEEFGDGVLDFYQNVQRLDNSDARFDLLDPIFMKRCDERTIDYHRANLCRWEATGHRFFCASVFVKQRHLFANNFLQHLDIAEPIVPFASFALIEYRLQNHWSCFGFETYTELLWRFFPHIGDVPHNTKLPCHKWDAFRPSHCTREWAARVLGSLMHSRRLPMLNRRKALPRLLIAMMGQNKLESAARFLYRLLLLDERVQRAGVPFDWRAI